MGRHWWREYDLPTNTRQSLTGGGGRQLFYTAPPGLTIKNQAGMLGPGVDHRADGGLVVLPPSLHASGKRYRWDTTYSDMLPAPIALVALLSKKAARPVPSNGHSPASPTAPGNGHSYAQARMGAAAQSVTTAPEGTRNDSLNQCRLHPGAVCRGGRHRP